MEILRYCMGTRPDGGSEPRIRFFWSTGVALPTGACVPAIVLFRECHKWRHREQEIKLGLRLVKTGEKIRSGVQSAQSKPVVFDSFFSPHALAVLATPPGESAISPFSPFVVDLHAVIDIIDYGESRI
jgi:hypothetical protein